MILNRARISNWSIKNGIGYLSVIDPSLYSQTNAVNLNMFPLYTDDSSIIDALRSGMQHLRSQNTTVELVVCLETTKPSYSTGRSARILRMVQEVPGIDGN